MTKFEQVIGTVRSLPVVEMESPFYLTFDLEVAGDTVQATFVGDMARALKNNIRPGDKVMPRKGIIDNGRLVFDFMHMEPGVAKGRNINFYA